MEDLIVITSYLPIAATLAGTVGVALMKRKNDTIWVLLGLALWTCVYYFLDAQAVNLSAPPELRFAAFSFLPFIVPMVLSYVVCLLWKIYNEKHLPWYHYLWFIPPIGLCSICLLLYAFTDSGEAVYYIELHDRLHHFPEQFESRDVFRLAYLMQVNALPVVQYVYSAWIIGYSIVSMQRTGFTWRSFVSFLFKRTSLPPMHFLMFMLSCLFFTISLRVAIGLYIILDFPWANAVFSVIQAIILGLISLAVRGIGYEECTLRQLLLIDAKEDLQPVADIFANDDDDDEEAVGVVANAPVRQKSVIGDAAADAAPLAENEKSGTAASDGNDSAYSLETFRQVQERLEVGLHELMDEQHAFLDSELRLSDVARTLLTNRNYLSRHINERYGVNFNEYLNRMRVDYSKEYMRKHPDESIDQLAYECGFGTAQSFSRKFKIKEGMTPRAWMAHNLKDES